MKKVWNIISTVFVWIIVLISVAMMVFTFISVNTFDRGDRDLFGYKAFIVLSDSMSATDFDAGDLVLIQEVDPTTLKEGDIITYQSQNSQNYGQNVTHKIRALTTTADGNPGFITYGTTTGIDDEVIVTYPYIQGKYVRAFPKVGTFFNFLRTPQGYILFILVPFLLLIGFQGINCVKAFRAYKKEQMAELQQEKDAIAEERRRNEMMMRQLMQMQQQMQQMHMNQTQPSAPPQPQAMEWDLSDAPAPVQQPAYRPEQQRPAQPQAPAYQTRTAPARTQPRTQAAPPARTQAPQGYPTRTQPATARPPVQKAPAPQPRPQAAPGYPTRTQAPAAPAARPRTQAPAAAAVQSRPTGAPAPARRPAPQTPPRQQVFDLPATDDSDVDDIIAELSALCGRDTNRK